MWCKQTAHTAAALGAISKRQLRYAIRRHTRAAAYAHELGMLRLRAEHAADAAYNGTRADADAADWREHAAAIIRDAADAHAAAAEHA